MNFSVCLTTCSCPKVLLATGPKLQPRDQIVIQKKAYSSVLCANKVNQHKDVIPSKAPQEVGQLFSYANFQSTVAQATPNCRGTRAVWSWHLWKGVSDFSFFPASSYKSSLCLHRDTLWIKSPSSRHCKFPRKMQCCVL